MAFEDEPESAIELEPILDPGDSPLQQPVIEHTGFDTFASPPPINPPIPNPTMIKDVNDDPNFTPPPNNFTPPSFDGPQSGDEFTAVDPEAEFMQQQQQQTVTMEEEMTKESTDMMSDMILDGAGMALPLLADAIVQIPETKIKQMERAGQIGPGATDMVADINRKNRGRVKFDKKYREFIRKPLEQVLQIHSVKADPTSMLIIAVVFVIGMMAIEAFRIKKENDALVNKLISEWERQKTAALNVQTATVIQ